MPRRPPRSALLPYARPFRAPPAVACGVALVVTVGEAFVTTTASAGSAQAVGPAGLLFGSQIGRAPRRERAESSVVAVSLKKKPVPVTVALLVKTEPEIVYPATHDSW